MNAKTLKALNGSIAKWKAIADGTGYEHGWVNCPLCNLFLDIGCAGCPVDKAGHCRCGDTPYETFDALGEPDLSGRTPDGRLALTDHAKSVAQKEVAFLESLLPLNTGAVKPS